MSWSDDPELVATFRAEVEERLTSLKDGLLSLESNSAPRQVIAALFRDAHTVKGSARMLGLDDVVGIAHRSEDLLGALRDGRFEVRRDLVDLLLAAADAIAGALPGADRAATPEGLVELTGVLDRAIAGDDPVEVPAGLFAEPAFDDDEPIMAGSRGRAGESVRVPTRRVHDLLDVVGETHLEARRIDRHVADVMTVAQSQADAMNRLRQAVLATPGGIPEVAEHTHAMLAISDQLQSAARELRGRVEDMHGLLGRVRDGAMGLAMVPVRRVVAGFPQLVREVASATDKDVVLKLEGEDVELDARVLDAVADALRHLVTNAVDHGCENPETRRAAGKSAQATVRVSARTAGSSVVVEVSDDGGGIDEDAVRERAISRGLLPEDSTLTGTPLFALLFAPGFSTRDEVTSTSGRGVGLDVVRTAVDELGGTVEISAVAGQGTTFSMTLPVTLGVMRCLVARLGDERYALPVTNVVETVDLRDVQTFAVAGANVIVRHGENVPLADLGAVLTVPGERAQRAAVVVRYGGQHDQLAWVVDALEGELELVVKDLGGFLGRMPHVTGATLDGSGSVMLLLDVRELALVQLGQGMPALPSGGAGASPAAVPVARRKSAAQRPRVLIVEDSVGVRELQRVILEGAGYEVSTAVDGLDGASRLQHAPVDLVLSDVEMPGMDGFTLTRTLRRTSGWENVPVVIMTSRGDDADKRAGLDAGADAYLLKSEFDQAELVATVQRLVGK